MAIHHPKSGDFEIMAILAKCVAFFDGHLLPPFENGNPMPSHSKDNPLGKILSRQ